MARPAKKRGSGNRSGFSIVVEDNRLQDIRKAMSATIGSVAEDIAFEAETNAKTDHRYQNRTGNLERNTYGQTTSTETGEGVAVEVGSHMFYTPYVEDWDAFLAPALEKALMNVEQRIETEFRRRAR